ncbi:MAG: GNAT family N-acetyltransferase [Euzebya sp.]
MRPINPLDTREVEAFTRRLSPTSRFRRFHSPVHRLSAHQLAGMIDVDHLHRESLVAIAGRRVVGVAQYLEQSSPPQSVDLAIVIADEYHGQGLGRTMMSAVIDAATATGYVCATALIQADNARALHLFRPTDRPVTASRSGATVEVRIELSHAPATTGAALVADSSRPHVEQAPRVPVG